MQCLLCRSPELSTIRHQYLEKYLFHCQTCDLIFKNPSEFLNWSEQKLRYDNHENSLESDGYKQFLEQLLVPLRPYLQSGQRVLDWGSGPGPVLSQLIRGDGLEVEIYDPIYRPEKPLGLFDVVTSTEVIEHFQEPRQILREILDLLKPGGIFAGLTQFHPGPSSFATWWYPRDPTHVVFYSERSFRWWAEEAGLEILFLKSPVFILRKFF
jgi:SAM-dependent methyltransferase